MCEQGIVGVVKEIGLIFAAFSFGMVAAAGVFTVFCAVSLVPRYIGKSRTAKEIILYENLVIIGTMIGSVVQMYVKQFHIGEFIRGKVGYLPIWWIVTANISQIIMGIFYGIFVGTLALSIAEMLDSMPIFTRRIRMKNGCRAMVVSIALGKMAGALFYFYFRLYLYQNPI